MKIPSVSKLIVALFVLAMSPEQVHALTQDQVFEKVKDSIVVVKTLDLQGKMKSQRSGVLLPSGKIATNCHVEERGALYQAGRDKEFVRATLYAEDGDKGICLLDAKGITGKPAQFGNAADLSVGVPVYAVGAPRGMDLSISDGIVAQLRGGPPPLIQTTATISPGSSGGGLFDGEGRLVGLMTLYLEGGRNLNFAMPVEWIDDAKPGRKQAARGRGQTEWLKRAIALEEMKEWQEMLDWCRKWTKNEPENADAWSCFGIAYFELDRDNDANKIYRQAIRIDAGYISAWFNLGLTYFTLKRHDDAIDAYRRTIRIDPEFADAWFGLGVVYDDLKRFNDAIDAYRQALRINSEDAEYWYNLGIAYSNLSRHNDAIESLRQAIRTNPEFSDAWNNLGIAYDNLKRKDDAIEAYRQAVRIDPKYADAWVNLWFAYYFSGNQTAALDAARELRHLDPERADRLVNEIMPR